MYLVGALVLAGIGFFLFRRWRKSLPVDQRLTLPYWRNTLFVTGIYVLSILVGAGITRVMVGFNRPGWPGVLMALFFICWVLYGAVWLVRFLPTTRPKPVWLERGRGWIDGAALVLLAALATAARML